MNSTSLKKTPVNTANKRAGRKRKHEKDEPAVSRRSKTMKRNRRKKNDKTSRKSSRFMEYAEYEYSGMDVSRPRQLQRSPSDNSIIYINTYHVAESGIPIIDLTKSSHSICCSRTASLKLIYKSKNFNSRLKNRPVTSLQTIPMSQHAITRNVNSTSNLSKSSKSILEIFPKYFDDDSDGSEVTVLHELSRSDFFEENRDVGMMGDEEDPSFNLESKQPLANINMCQCVIGDGS
ncbi:uncharacterized protein LOC126743491 [Anthonomus grandis grandis]|uniref:uncharacterized protein LOC126743491 n=1 Tax=Anthonomus grandis grandis TaxID=2921223 RepID=UPI002165CA70|nr:uncharacterized protein LOC126743491 [Anthonomus grandis grandis]